MSLLSIMVLSYADLAYELIQIKFRNSWIKFIENKIHEFSIYNVYVQTFLQVKFSTSDTDYNN